MNENDPIRDQIWMGLLNADRVSRYYALLSRKHRRRYRLFSGLAALSATGAAASLIAQGPDWLSGIVALTTAANMVWLLLTDPSGKATAAGLFAEFYGELTHDWRDLWYGSATQEDIQQLRTRYSRITAGYELDEEDDLNERAQREAYEAIPAEFYSNEGETAIA